MFGRVLNKFFVTKFILNENLYHSDSIKKSYQIHKFDSLFVIKDKVGKVSLDQTGELEIKNKRYQIGKNV